jgi:hypothetical protein
MSFSNDLVNDKIIPAPTITVTFAGEIGRLSKNCEGFGFSCLDLIIEIGFGKVNKPNTTIADVTMLDPNTMSFTFKPDAGEPDKSFLVEKASVNLFQPLAKSFGYTSIVLIEGSYNVVKQRDGRMTATIKALTKN